MLDMIVTLTLSLVMQYMAPVESILILMSIVRTYSVQGLIILSPGLINRLNLPNSSTIPAKWKIEYQSKWEARMHMNIGNKWVRKGMPNIHRILRNKYYMIIQKFGHDADFADIEVSILKDFAYPGL